MQSRQGAHLCRARSSLTCAQHFGCHLSAGDNRNVPVQCQHSQGPVGHPEQDLAAVNFHHSGKPTPDTSTAKPPFTSKLPRNTKSTFTAQCSHTQQNKEEKSDFLRVIHLSKRTKRHKERGRNSLTLSHMCLPQNHRVMVKAVSLPGTAQPLLLSSPFSVY